MSLLTPENKTFSKVRKEKEEAHLSAKEVELKVARLYYHQG